MSAGLICPVCQARFRGRCECPRCGADLAPLMRLALDAWRRRRAARQALDRDEYGRAIELAGGAQQLHRTLAGESLRTLSAWLHAKLDHR